MAGDCIFCKIGKGEMKGDIVDRDAQVFVLRDIHPQAPVHLLVMPFKHIASIADVGEADAPVVTRMVLMANKVAAREGIAQRGYRLAVNCRDEGGQTVGHLHMHVLGGRQLTGHLG